MKMRSSPKRKSHNHIKRSNPNTTAAMADLPSSVFIKQRIWAAASILLILSVLVLLGVSSNMWFAFSSAVPVVRYYYGEVVREYPHDPEAFTQGLLYDGNNTLFESTGLYGRSSVRRVSLQSGKVEVVHKMESSYFGEGLTLLGERLFQVTWLKKTGFIYDRSNLSNFKTFTHQMQDGWGLATDGKVLFGSDGSSTLYRIDPQTMKVIDRQIIKFKSHEVHNLNELEFINGEVWANVYQTDCIARISYADGRVISWILLPNLREGLIAAGNYGIDVLNGIAWDKGQDRLFVTGKLWPKIYEIKLHPVAKQVNDELTVRNCLRKPFHF